MSWFKSVVPSHTSGPHLLIGDYDKETRIFTPTWHQPFAVGEICSYSGGLGAGSAMQDGNGGAYAIFNIKDGMIHCESHTGMMSLPRHITSIASQVRIQPVQSVDTLRDSERKVDVDVLKRMNHFR